MADITILQKTAEKFYCKGAGRGSGLSGNVSRFLDANEIFYLY